MRRPGRATVILALLALAGAAGCGRQDAREPVAAAETLAVPHTADEIRDEWAEGLSLLLRFRSPGREEMQLWTVVAADAEGAEILYQAVDAEGQPLGEPRRARSSWTELRDHALFPAADARRLRETRDTAMGRLEGWLYTVRDPQAETETRFFFADQHPGAPIWMMARRGDELLMEVTQLSRRRPEEAVEPAEPAEPAE